MELTIYILCHNRPDYARQAITSVLEQTSPNFTLTVSDNSSIDDVERMVKGEFPSISYVRRSPTLALWEHFNRCIEDARGEFFCLFHDDDLMKPDFVETMGKCLADHPAAIAFGCNAKFEKMGKLELRTSFRSFRDHEFITSPRDLAARYFSRAQSGYAPFPGYVYNRRLVGNYRFPLDGGKYADVTWLLNLATKGQIVWINKSLMIYRLHGNNVGNIESMRDRLRLLAYLKKNRAVYGEGILNDYRCSFIYKKILRAHVDISCRRYQVAASFLKYYRLSRYARFSFYKALAVRALVKLVAE